jgi:hypothetical protein
MGSLFAGLTGFTLFGSWIYASIALAVFIIALFVSEVVKEGAIAFIALVALLVLNYYRGNLPLLELVTWSNSLGYLGTGLLFACIRVYFYGRKMAKDGNGFSTIYLQGNVLRWWFIWPVALLKWVFSDLLADFWELVYDKLAHTFESIMRFGYDSVKKTVTNNTVTE